MQKLTIRLLLISLFSLLFCSCKSYKLDDVTKVNSIEKKVQNNYFSNPETDYVYKANIEVYGNNIGGIFIAKQINDTLHRMVFTTDFGNKLMDFELSKNSFKVNYIVEDLDRNIIKNVLKADFRLLLQTDYKIDEVFENERSFIYKSQAKRGYNYLFIDKKNDNLVKLLNTSKRKEKVTFEFESKNSTFAENVRITHQNIKLKIKLNQISN